jgi:hypothetical protein
MPLLKHSTATSTISGFLLTLRNIRLKHAVLVGYHFATERASWLKKDTLVPFEIYLDLLSCEIRVLIELVFNLRFNGVKRVFRLMHDLN